MEEQRVHKLKLRALLYITKLAHAFFLLLLFTTLAYPTSVRPPHALLYNRSRGSCIGNKGRVKGVCVCVCSDG